MAKKIDAIKDEIGFSKVAPMRGNCKHFSTEKETITGWTGQEYTLDKKLRCAIGGFKVGKSNWCRKHEQK